MVSETRDRSSVQHVFDCRPVPITTRLTRLASACRMRLAPCRSDRRRRREDAFPPVLDWPCASELSRGMLVGWLSSFSRSEPGLFHGLSGQAEQSNAPCGLAKVIGIGGQAPCASCFMLPREYPAPLSCPNLLSSRTNPSYIGKTTSLRFWRLAAAQRQSP